MPLTRGIQGSYGDVEGLEEALFPLADMEGTAVGESSCYILRSIYIEDPPWHWHLSGANPQQFDHAMVQEIFGSAAVNKRAFFGPSSFAHECKVSCDSIHC